jgi:hypothetical protein
VTESRLIEARNVLEGLEEVLVLGFHLDESSAAFELVCEFRGKSAGADRAFVRFQFFSVQRFKRKPGLYAPLQKVGTTYLSRTVQGAWVIQAVDTRKIGTFATLSISLGASFGGIEFGYEDVTYEVIQLYAKPNGINDWAYFEVGTDRPVDFYNPFGTSWADVQ